MSDSRKVYRTIRAAILQLYPGKIKGDTARMLTILAAMVVGIVMGKSCQLPTIARKAPDLAKANSRVKRYSRWINSEKVNYEGFYLPFISEILNRLAEIRELVFVMDGSEFGNGCITLMISLLYNKRAIPVTWLVVKGKKGHLPEEMHLELMAQLHAILPKKAHCIFLGDGEFDGIQLQEALKQNALCLPNS